MNANFTRMAAAVSLAVLHMSAHSQQDIATAPAPGADGLGMERIVITGTSGGASKMKSSISVSTMEEAAIQQAAPTSAAEVLRSIPGLRSESSGGEGNANITVRGVPISAGGARYVQIQEDGLPVLQSGDFNFITPDAYVRIDGALDHLEVVRGGSASTLATNSPGGIINFISKTGVEKGGSIGVTKGLDYNTNRVDFDYGAPIDNKTRFFVGGFYRSGEGIRSTGMTSEKGGQLRANITRDFDGGFVRLSVKHLDDQTPTALPVPVSVTNQHISTIAGIDPRSASFYSNNWVPDVVLGKNNQPIATDVNSGLTVKSDSVGLEAQYKLGGGWTLSENARKSTNTGRFIGVFPGNNGASGSYIVASGPATGSVYNGRAFSAVVFNTSIDDAGSAMSDTRLARTFALDDQTKLTATGGLYASRQNLGLTWNFNEYLMQETSSNPALLKTASTTPGLVGPAFGGCCSRAIDMRYKYLSPYLNLGLERGALNVDASVRHDRQQANGVANIATNGVRYDPATRQFVNYSLDHNSYSVGGNYRITPALAVFARVSDGVAFNADRILFGTPLDGSKPININTVKQIEGGVKWRSGGFSTFATLFQAKTEETNYEATTQKTTANSYDAKGVELESAYQLGAFRINGGLTLTDAKITATAPGGEAVIGNTPRRQARAIYQAAPTYSFGPALVGVSIIGTGQAWADDAHTILMPGYRVVHGFLNYQVSAPVLLTVSFNNLFNKLAYTEVEGDGHAARALTGRAIKAGLKYAF